MPWRLIWYIFVLICIFTFIGLNLGNTSDINLWFTESGQMKDVPIFISFFVMYILGAVSVIPYVVGSRIKTIRTKKKEKKSIPAKSESFNAQDDADKKA